MKYIPADEITVEVQSVCETALMRYETGAIDRAECERRCKKAWLDGIQLRMWRPNEQMHTETISDYGWGGGLRRIA